MQEKGLTGIFEIAPAINSTYFQKAMNVPGKTLIIRFSSIGDIVLASPLLRVLRKKFPASRIDFATRSEFAELVKYNPNIDRVYELDASKGMKEICRLRKTIRENKYDLILDIHNSIRSRMLRLFNSAGRTEVVNKRILARTMLVKFRRNYYRDNISVSERYIETLKRHGVRGDGDGPEIFVPEGISEKISERMEAEGLKKFRKVFGFCPSAKHATKCWPAERYIEVGKTLAEEYDAKILIFGGSEDSAKNRYITGEINKSMQKRRAEDFNCGLLLLETAAAMKYCDLIITNDTGLMHIASAQKRSIVAIFGSSVREFGFSPAGSGNIVLEVAGLYCRPCSHIGRDKCPEGHFRCMNEIRTADVLDSVRKIIGHGK
jgi:lipopolysaccharide heptosyltransferase II